MCVYVCIYIYIYIHISHTAKETLYNINRISCREIRISLKYLKSALDISRIFVKYTNVRFCESVEILLVIQIYICRISYRYITAISFRTHIAGILQMFRRYSEDIEISQRYLRDVF